MACEQQRQQRLEAGGVRVPSAFVLWMRDQLCRPALVLRDLTVDERREQRQVWRALDRAVRKQYQQQRRTLKAAATTTPAPTAATGRAERGERQRRRAEQEEKLVRARVEALPPAPAHVLIDGYNIIGCDPSLRTRT
eukprot:TRINITY_DN73_c1_g1_i1.p2 TRINITY_DN73_c1_g1~~TRINITY_DN73_c1_g1_i1.p2  ORF type:complete len:137 (-),score=46.08 TRINITY_DN73_c1_g1_i1:507-917(-)